MARSAAARKARPSPSPLVVVHPSRESKIERKSEELVTIREQIKDLEARKVELSAQLLRLVKIEGEADEKGKVRYETDTHRFVVVGGSSVHTSGDKVVQALVKLGVKATVAKKAVARGTSKTEYEYVRVDVRKPDPDADASA